MACYLPSHVGVATFTTLWRCVPKLGGHRALPRQHPNANAAYYCSRARANVKGGCELSNDGEFNPVEAEDISSSSGESNLKGNPAKLEDFPHSSVVSNLKGDGLKSSNDRLMLIDGTAVIYRAYFKLMCLTFRHTLYPAYKGNRIPTPDTIVQGLQYLKAAMKAMSIKVIEVPGVEADDVIGTLATSGVAASLKVRIVSPDKDFFQILSPSLRILRVAPRGSQVVSFGLEQFAEKYGDLKPSQIVDVMALAGDKADNIPGIDGIGDINALKLIMEFGSVENLLHCLDQVADDNIRKLLRHNTGQALLSKSLATLRSDLPFYMVPFKISDLVFEKPQDKGKKFINLLRAISAYAEGSSAVNIVNRALSLWEKC